MMALLRLKVIWIIGCACTFMVLGGCSATNSGDLQEYIAEILARPGGRIEPLPEIKPYEAYTYQSSGQDARDPFKLFYQKDEEMLREEQENSGLTKEMEAEVRHRNKEELEKFELDSLRMVGTIEKESEDIIWAIIQDPDGELFRIRVGNYMGQNTGKVLRVFEDRVELREIFRSSQGRWEERDETIKLVELDGE